MGTAQKEITMQRSRPNRSRRPRHRADDFYGPLDALDDVGTGFIGGLLSLGQSTLESTSEHALYFANHQARRLGRAIKRRFGGR